MKNILVLVYMIIVNLILSVTKMTVGVLFASQALLVDGIDSLMDSFSNIIGIAAIKHSNKDADHGHPFGHGNSEYIATLLLSVLIVATSVFLGVSIFDGTFVVESHPSMIVLVTITATMIVKIIVSTYLVVKGKKNKNSIISALGWENVSDIPKAVVVLIGVVLQYFNADIPADKYAGLIISALILISGVKMFIESYNALLGQIPDSDTLIKIRKLCMVDGVESINDLKAIKKGPYYIVIVCVYVDRNITVAAGHDIATLVKDSIMSLEEVKFVNVHVDPCS